MALFGLWSACVFFGLIDIKERAGEDKPEQKQKTVLPPTVSKMEWVNFGNGFELVEVHDIDCNVIKLN